MNVQRDVILARHCRFNVGGPANHFAVASCAAELAEALDYARRYGLRHFILAGGSNLFFDDAGFRGLVIKLADGGWELQDQQARLTASAGYSLGELIRELAEEDHGGLEFLANIPGSVGGAVVGNAGCYGQAIADVLTGAEIFDTQQHDQREVGAEFFEYDYRHSRLKYTDRYIVVSATLQVSPGRQDEILEQIAAELDERRSKHPHDAQCAGSYFKNPSRELPAWQVITEAGLAGARVGDACLSPMHANFLINEGGASSAQIIELTHKIQRAVRGHAGIELIPEVRYVSPTGVVELKAD